MPIREDRIREVQKLMGEHGIDALLLLNHDEYLYFIGEQRNQPRAIIPREGEPVVIAFREELEEVQAKTGAKVVRTFSSLGEQMNAVIKTLAELGLQEGTIGIQMGFTTPYFLVDRFQRANPKVRVVNSAAVIMPLRMIKTDEELSFMRKAAEIAAIGMKAAMSTIKDGVMENEVAAEAEYAMRRAGAQGVAVPTFVNSGYRSGWLHGRSTYKMINQGELIVLDLLPIYHGYCANLARTVVLGEPTEPQQRLFEAYLAAQRAVLETIKPGVAVSALDAAAERALSNAGYGQYFVRGISHGIGLAFEETPAPTIVPGDGRVVLQTGMTITAGHSILFVPHIGGVRLEDVVLVSETGWEPLTDYPRQLSI
ncbi:MAG: Xaa-Pro peptidase family protein [Chloroflexi bacterium]|nr:Xaa-Pro peptidase family protein [Chloroflexota bacterium]